MRELSLNVMDIAQNSIRAGASLTTIRVDESVPGGTLAITVADNGPGLTEDAQKHIFDKFYQADSSHRQEGNGLGLTLVKRILTMEKGQITAENRPGGGCKFTVILQA